MPTTRSRILICKISSLMQRSGKDYELIEDVVSLLEFINTLPGVNLPNLVKMAKAKTGIVKTVPPEGNSSQMPQCSMHNKSTGQCTPSHDGETEDGLSLAECKDLLTDDNLLDWLNGN